MEAAFNSLWKLPLIECGSKQNIFEGRKEEYAGTDILYWWLEFPAE